MEPKHTIPQPVEPKQEPSKVKEEIKKEVIAAPVSPALSVTFFYNYIVSGLCIYLVKRLKLFVCVFYYNL